MSFPQHTGVPSAIRAHVWFGPALMVVNLAPAGGEDLPSDSDPQHTGVPSVINAQTCSVPALIVANGPSGGSSKDLAFLTQTYSTNAVPY